MFATIKNLFTTTKKSFWHYDYTLWGFTFFWDPSKNKKLSNRELLDLYTGWSFVCIGIIAEGISGLERKLLWSENRFDREKKSDYMNLITSDLLEEIAGFLEITGTVFVRKHYFWKSIEKLEVLRSDLVTIEKTVTGDLKWYTYNKNGNLKFFTPDDVFVIKNFSPYKDGRGVSTLQAVWRQQSMDEEAVNYNWNFFKYWWSSGTSYTTEQDLTKEKKIALLEHLRENLMGTDNANKMAIFDKGLKENEKKPGQKDMDFVNMRDSIRDEVFMIFRVSKVLAGLNDGVGYTDRTVAYENLARIKLYPMALRIQEALNTHVFWGIGFFSFVNVIPVDREQLLKDYQLGLITRWEYRTLSGYQAIQNGDVLINGESIEYEEKNKKKEITAEDSIKGVLSKKIAKAFKTFDISEKWLAEDREKKLELRWDKKILRTDQYEKKFNLLMGNIFDLQEKEIIKKINTLSKKSLEDVNDLKEEDLFVETAILIIYQNQFKKLFQDIVLEEGKIAMREVLKNGVFSMVQPEKWIGKNIKRFALDIDMTTRKQIIEIIKKEYKAGSGTAVINKKIREKFQQYKTSRVNKISRTEITNSVTYSRIEAWEQSKVVEYKQWWTALDERVSPECSALHGKKIKLKDTFYKKGDKDSEGKVVDYMDVEWPPKHVNCRCDLIWIIKE